MQAAFLWRTVLSPAPGHPRPPRPPWACGLTLGTKPGSTFFSLSSVHSTSASAGAACMSCRLDTRCLGFTVSSWNKAPVSLPRAQVYPALTGPGAGLPGAISRQQPGSLPSRLEPDRMVAVTAPGGPRAAVRAWPASRPSPFPGETAETQSKAPQPGVRTLLTPGLGLRRPRSRRVSHLAAVGTAARGEGCAKSPSRGLGEGL